MRLLIAAAAAFAAVALAALLIPAMQPARENDEKAFREWKRVHSLENAANDERR